MFCTCSQVNVAFWHFDQSAMSALTGGIGAKADLALSSSKRRE
jgi:hypothetical protein